MPAIQIVEAASIPWHVHVGTGENHRLMEMPEPDDGRPSMRYRHPGSETEPYLHEGQLPPNAVVESHAHRGDEIVYVLDGELHLGARVLGPGSSVLIPGMTLYGFRAGPTGLRFLNFRGHREDQVHISKEEFLAERRHSSPTESA